MILRLVLLLSLWVTGLYCQCQERDLMQDLMIVDFWNRKIYDRLPVTYNHLLQGGYWNMPSARMGGDGEVGVGYAYVPPYINYNMRVQILPCLEISGNYRIFKGVSDPILTPLGFGDLSDKGANVKLSLFTPEDSGYILPGVSVGYEDFIGTRNFRSRYVVLTQVVLPLNAEFTFGWGWQRIHGAFGGASWMPFRTCGVRWFEGISLAAEYDPTHYHDPGVEHHPKGRVKKSPINFGMKWRLLNYFDLSLSYVRGAKLAFSASAFYNFGYTDGFLPKIEDPLPCNLGACTPPAGIVQLNDLLAEELTCKLREQGFDLLKLWLEEDPCNGRTLRMRLLNNVYWREWDVREHLTNLLAGCIPEDVDTVIAAIDSDGFPMQEYLFRMEFLRKYAEGEICKFEVDLLSPLREVTYPNPCNATLIHHQRRDWWNVEILPKTANFFGSSKGKFKYALGISLALNGFLPQDIYYSTLFSYIAVSNYGHLTGIDRLNPSQLINVRSDLPEYLKTRVLTVDQAYAQKSWNMGRGWFSRVAGGLFEVEYGGIAAEFLFFPVHSRFAFGIEGAYLRKRTHTGIGFTDKVRKMDGFRVTHRKFYGKQYFANFYYNLEECSVDFRIKAGKFLANDYGARFEIARYFPSGLELYCWYTYTNGHDVINGKTYHDKGIGFAMPLDIFYTHSERQLFGSSMSAWLRDVGVIAATGKELFELLSEQRD